MSRTKLSKLLSQPQNKEIRDQIIDYIGVSESRMAELMDFFFHEEWRYNQSAAWPLGVIGENNPHLLLPYLTPMLENLKQNPKDAVVRNTVRTLQYIELPEELEGPVYDICMNYLLDIKQAVAIRAFSMTTLANIAEKHPELRSELIVVIQEYFEIESSGFKARARKIIKRFQ